jgi:3-phytase
MRLIVFILVLVIAGAAWFVVPERKAQVPVVVPQAETVFPVAKEDTLDDPAIWLHPTNPAKSLVIATDKHKTKGGLHIYDLGGRHLSFIAAGRHNNVDLVYDFKLLNGEKIDLVCSGHREKNMLSIFRVDPNTRILHPAAAREITVGITPYGFCMYQNKNSGKVYAIVNSKKGEVEQWELFAAPDDFIDAKRVRTLKLKSQTEGCVADSELGYLYIGEENVGIWKYPADPGQDDTHPILIDSIENGRLTADVEGLSIYYARNGKGYLIASSQGDDTFAIYERSGDNRYVSSFSVGRSNTGIDSVQACDGLDVISTGLGKLYPNGLVVVHDHSNSKIGGANFKFVSWDNVAKSVEPNLIVDPTWNPRKSKPLAPGMIAESEIAVASEEK